MQLRFFYRVAVASLLLVAATMLLLWLIGRSPAGWLATGVLTSIAAVIVADQLTRPVRRMARSAKQFAAGDHSHRFEVHGDDELGTLAESFNATSARINEQLESITLERNRLEAMVASMAEGVLAVDAQDHVLHMNDVARRLLRVPPDRPAVGRAVLEITRHGKIVDAIATASEEARVVSDTIHLGEGADEQVIELNATPLTGSGSEGAVVVLHDVTKLHQLEGIRRDFVSNVSHELKTPLTAIRGFVETMLDASDIDDATRHRFLSKMSVQTSRLSTLVSDLLSLSRIESAQSGEPVAVDLRAPLLDCLRTLRPSLEAQDLVLETSYPDVPVIAYGEQEAFRQAFSNLVDNAIKYTPQGGRVIVRLTEDAQRVLFEVRDSGPGIEDKHLDRIFERFYRVDRARSRELGGTGLGLAIVKNVATGSGGAVEVESEMGQGSVFRMVWPKTLGQLQRESA